VRGPASLPPAGSPGCPQHRAAPTRSLRQDPRRCMGYTRQPSKVTLTPYSAKHKHSALPSLARCRRQRHVFVALPSRCFQHLLTPPRGHVASPRDPGRHTTTDLSSPVLFPSPPPLPPAVGCSLPPAASPEGTPCSRARAIRVLPGIQVLPPPPPAPDREPLIRGEPAACVHSAQRGFGLRRGNK